MSWNKKNDIFALFVGHGKMVNGKWDSGCAYGKYTEADLMLKITKYAVKLLRKSGVRVLTDADKGNNRNMKSSVAWANKYANNAKNHCRFYMSVHCDYKLASAGVAPLFVSAKGKSMAVTVGKYVAKYMGMKWKGAFKRTNLYELNATKMPSVIFETGAIKADLKYLKQYKKYGRALARGICKFIGVTYYADEPAYKFDKKYKEILNYANKHNFKYVKDYGDCAKTWDGAKKKKQMCCSMAVSYALQEAGIIPKGYSFYCTDYDQVKFHGGMTMKDLEKIAKIYHPHKTPKSIKTLKKGDITGYGKPYGNPHTMEYSCSTSKGTPKWCSWGTADIGKPVPHVKKTYTSKKISTLIRLK